MTDVGKTVIFIDLCKELNLFNRLEICYKFQLFLYLFFDNDIPILVKKNTCMIYQPELVCLHALTSCRFNSSFNLLLLEAILSSTVCTDTVWVLGWELYKAWNGRENHFCAASNVTHTTCQKSR